MNEKLKRILYAEDEPDIREVAYLALEAVGGFTVLLCESGQAALDSVEDFAPDVILLDMMMPGLDGTETLKRLQEHPTCADVPVIFMTAKVQRHEVNSYRALGALDVIPKPFDPMTLAATVENLWNENRAE